MNDNYFERFWSCYPNKKGKGQAQRSFDKAFLKITDEDKENLTMQMVLAIDAQKRERKRLLSLQAQGKLGTKLIADWKHPSTWITGQCWLDEFEEEEVYLAKPKCLYKDPCHQCKENAVIKVNDKQYCAWHYSKEFCNEGDTGLNRLREAYRNRIRQEPGEIPYQYFVRVCGTKQIKPSLDSTDNRQSENAFPQCESG